MILKLPKFGRLHLEKIWAEDKTGQKGTNSVFVMTHKEIDIAKRQATNGLTCGSLSTTDPQKRIPIESGSQLGATSSHIKATH